MKPKNPFEAFDRYCIRTPGLNFEFLEGLFKVGNIEIALKEILKSNLLREAIYLASPVLFSQIQLWEKDNIKDTKKCDRIKYTLLKYLTRMSSRCTPFGLFAGVALGKVDTKSNIELADNNEHHRITRYDMHFLIALAQNLSQQEHIKNQLKYYPNPTLYCMGGRYRYVEYIYENKKRVHSIESVLHSKYLESILEKAKTGSLISQLTNYLVDEEFEVADSVDFICALIENQILVSELEPTITGEDYLWVLKQKLTNLTNNKGELKVLDTLTDFLKKVSLVDYPNLSVYKSIKDYVSSLKIDVEPQFLIQTDLYPKFKQNQLNQRVLKKVKLGLWVLNKISDTEKNLHLEQFKTAFNKRWEHQKVPLLNVIDIESGIGYANNQVDATPFLDDVQLPIQKKNRNLKLSAFQEMLLDKVQKCLIDKEVAIELDINDLDAFDENWDNAPDTLSVMAEIVIQNKSEKVVMSAAGAHASRLLGRFAVKNNEMTSLVREIVEKEKEMNTNKILAEIVHVPESRTGNILRRPYIREHEIPCLGNSYLPLNKQLALQDILVSVDYGQINLTHGPSGKSVLPRLSNAHNYRGNSLPIYQFLCDLQYQDQYDYAFNWGSLMNELAFLPRVVFKDIILSKARWKITSAQIKKKEQTKFDASEDLYNQIKTWKNELKIPDRVQLVEGDNTLLIDFNSSWSVKLLLENIKNKESFVLQEILEDDNPIVKSNKTTFRSEFVFAFYNNYSKLLN